MTAFSLSEAEALITKAARGAGLPWGLAAEAGKAARAAFSSTERSEDVAQAFADWLSDDPGGEDCPLTAGLLLRDKGEDGAVSGGPLILRAALGALPKGAARRAVIKAEALSVFETLAHRTYAPATEESRARGAG